jgi:CheY-like chemotaxis protein
MHAILLKRISGKIKTPLNGILDILDVIKGKQLDNESLEYLSIINSYGIQVLTTINDVTDFSGIQSGKIGLKLDIVDVQSEIESIVNSLQYRAEGKKIKIISEVTQYVPTQVVADADKLKQIIMNLADNALNNSNDGSITISVDNLGELEDGKVMLVFKVQDTGAGIRIDLAQELYAALGYKDSSLLLKIKNGGLGLAIAKDICSLFRGEISFESEPGVGSVFWFTATFDTSIKKTVSTTDEYYVKKNLKILLVEDNILNQKFVRATLQREGHEIEIAENGKIAIEKASKSTYDMILMDIQMPIMDGIEATLKIRELENDKAVKTKVIAVTAFALDKDKTRCLAAGMNDFLAKPFKPKELLSVVNRNA